MHMLCTKPFCKRRRLPMLLHAVPAQTVQRTKFKPEMLAPASLQLVAPNVRRQPKQVSGANGRAASATVHFEPRGLPPRSGAQLLGAFTNRALGPSKLCFAVGRISQIISMLS